MAAKNTTAHSLRVAVDCVVFGIDQHSLRVMLVQRGLQPFKGAWALPGGFILPNESLDQAARRELREETGLADAFLEQLYTFGSPDRDPRGRVISVAYYALVRYSDVGVRGGSDAADAAWHPVTRPPALAFDHSEILATALARLRAKIRYQPIGFELLPDEFSLGQLQRLYELILERPLDKRNFRRRILDMDLLIDTGATQQGVSHRAAKLYRFDQRRYRALVANGFNFEL